MGQVIFLIVGLIGLVLSILNIMTQNSKRTVNRWARDIVQTGQINSRATTELGTIYANPFADCCIEIDGDNKYRILRNERIREKIREYRRYKKFRDRLSLILLVFVGLLFYVFVN